MNKGDAEAANGESPWKNVLNIVLQTIIFLIILNLGPPQKTLCPHGVPSWLRSWEEDNCKRVQGKGNFSKNKNVVTNYACFCLATLLI